MRRNVDPPGEGSLKQWIILLALAFLVTLGVVIGTRMSSDAIAVLVGVIAGVAASIPTALLLMAVTRRREEEYLEPYEEPHRSSPPVIVVAPGAVPQALPPYAASYPYQAPLPPARPRQFRVMGYEEEEEQPVEGEAEVMSWYQ